MSSDETRERRSKACHEATRERRSKNKNDVDLTTDLPEMAVVKRKRTGVSPQTDTSPVVKRSKKSDIKVEDSDPAEEREK